MLTALGLILLYMVAWVPALYLWVVVWDGNERATLIGALGALVLIVVGFVPYLNFVIRRVFYLPGVGEPVSEEELHAMLREINDFDAPVTVIERGRRLVVTWRYVDARWWELLARSGLTKVYELHIRLNGAKKEATLVDVLKSVSWGAGPTEVQVTGGYFRGASIGYEIGEAWGIRENFAPGQIYEYEFSPQVIKNPVVNSILRSGWSVRFGMW
jgi:hypothetical protein